MLDYKNCILLYSDTLKQMNAVKSILYFIIDYESEEESQDLHNLHYLALHKHYGGNGVLQFLCVISKMSLSVK